MHPILRPSLLVLLIIGAAAIACTPASTTAVAELEKNSAGHACPVTQPPEPAFVPPQGWPAAPPEDGRFWVGSDGLWTALPHDGRWGQLARGEKFWWWSANYVMAKEPEPALTITARPLDGSQQPVTFEDATNGHHPSFGQAMLIGVELPSTGCWELTGAYGKTKLTVVVDVPE